MKKFTLSAQNHEEVRRQLRGALSLLLVTVIATTAGVWASVKYSELAFNVGKQSQLAGAAAAAAPAGTIPLSGWMWSGYMGWISLSSDNKGEGNTYAVYENVSTGSLSGYAWSGNLGWVSFNAADVASCPSGGAAPSVNLSTGKVSGWARACSAFEGAACSGTLDTRSGGWDGCISLGTQTGETYTYEITQNLATCEWSGYAWGSTAIGWTNANPWAGYGVKCEKPNLKYISATPSPLTGSVSAPTTYIATFTNVGGARTNSLFGGSSAPIRYSFRWADNSLGNNWTTMAGATGFPTSGDLAGGETVTKSVSFQFPASAAGTTRYISICADSDETVAESNEGDNCSGWTPVNLAGTPNLVPSPITPTPSTATVNVAQNFSTTITNSGSASAGSSAVIFRRANDAQGTGAVDLTPSVTVSALAVNAQAMATKSISFATAGTFYLQACADMGDLINEGTAGEADNCTNWVSITVSAAPTPDLQQDQIGWQGGPPTTGTQISFTGSIKNTGTGAISGGVPSVYRVKNSLSPTAKVWAVLDAGTIPSIAANAAGVALTASQGYSTSTPGTLYVDICANASVATPTTMSAPPVNTAELAANAGNNCGQIMQIPISLSQVVPNYKVSAAPTVIGTPVTGGSLTFSAIVRNASSTAATSTSNILFQVDMNPVGTVWSTGITNLDTVPNRPVPALAGNALDTTARTSPAWTVPATPGSYRVRACADLPAPSYIGEGSENDNCGAETPFTVGGLPDLTVTALTPTTATNGQAATYSATVQNGGTATTGAGFTTLFQAAVTSTGGGAVDIGTFPRATALSNTAGSNTFAATLSYATTTTRTSFYIRACADKTSAANTGAITESNEGNNCLSPWVQVMLNAAATVPTVASPTATSLTTTGATLGATVSSNGGATLTESGTCWSTTAIAAGTCPNKLATGAIATVATPFSHARTGMLGGTLYHYRGYATNSVGTGYSTDATFTTASLGITVTGAPYSVLFTAPTATASYTLTNGTTANTKCLLGNSVKTAIGTYDACPGTRSITAPSVPGDYGYYMQASSTISANQKIWSTPAFHVYVTSPYLTANALTGLPANGTVGSAITLNGSINNASTTLPVSVSNATAVPSVYRVKTSSGGTPIAYIDAGSKNLPKGSTGASAVALSQGSYTPTSVGAYYFDVCVNMGTDTIIPKTSEYRSTDNCGPESSVTVAAAPTFSCTGLPANATPYPAPDNTGLTVNTAYTFSATDTAAKCQFGGCASGYTWNSTTGTCVQDPPPPPSPVNGTCGSAHGKTYPSGATTYGADTQCAAGTPSSPWTFPAAGSSSTWTCSGTNNGTSASCFASRDAAATAPVITSFTANPTRDEAGYITTLTWTSTGATSCTMSRLAAGQTTAITLTAPTTSGSKQDTVNGETVYTLTCTNGPLSDSEEVIVDTNPIICEIGQNC